MPTRSFSFKLPPVLKTRIFSVFVTLVIFSFISVKGGYSTETTVPVRVSVAQMKPIFDDIPLSGSVLPRRESALSPEVDGLVSEILVDEGDEVKQGDILVKLDKVIAKLDAEQAGAALEEAQEKLKETVRQRDEAAKLVKKRHVPETAYKASIADVRMKQALLRKLTAEYERSAEISKRYIIKAPFGGVVGNILTEIGQWVETGTTVLELFDIQTLRIRVEVPQRYFSLIEVATPVSLRFDALPERVFDRNVSRKIPIGNSATRTFPVQIDLTNQQGLIAPGMSARVSFLIRQTNVSPVLLIPKDAVVKAADGSATVWQVLNNGSSLQVTPISIKTGRLHDQSVEVVNGPIKPGDRLVIRGNEILKPGQKVRLSNHGSK